MKKIFTLLCCIAATSFAVNAQNILFEDDFQGTTFPKDPKGNDYTIYDLDGNTINSQLPLGVRNAYNNSAWTRIVTFDNDPERFVSSTSWYTPKGTANDWLITPKVTLSAAIDNWLFYKTRTLAQGGGETYQVLISTTTTEVDSFNLLYNETNSSGPWKSEKIDLSSYAGQAVYIAFRNTTFGGTVIAIDDIVLASDVPSAEASVEMINVPGKINAGTTNNIEATISYYGVDSLGSVDLNWSIDGGATKTQSITGLNLNYGNTSLITHSDQWTTTNSDAGKVVKLKVWTSNPNGETDKNTSNDTLVKSIIIGNGNTVQRDVLFEEFTTTECIHCPDGHMRAAAMARNISNLIQVNVHSCFRTDSMTNPDATKLCNVLGANAAPTGMVDRILFDGEKDLAFNRVSWMSRASARATVGSEAEISFENASYNASSRKVTFDVVTNFVDYITAGDLRLSLIVVEDSLVGSGAGWDQKNAGYNVPGYGTGSILRNYVHKHVLREIKPSTWGDATVFPNKIDINKEYTKNFSITLDSKYDPKQISFVAVVSYKGTDKSGYEVINAKEASLSVLKTGINELSSEIRKLNVYPNPSADLTNIEIDLKESTDLALVLRDLTGKVVYEKNYGEVLKGTYKLPIDLSSFSNGFYFLNIKVGDNQISRKIIVNK